jgi:hypothetical protein
LKSRTTAPGVATSDLGYSRWEHGLVIDRWTQSDDRANIVREHADECFYLTKPLSG